MSELSRVRAADLRPGDYCLGSKQTVLGTAEYGIGIPTGKVEIHLERANGTRRTALWNRQTRIGILRGD